MKLRKLLAVCLLSTSLIIAGCNKGNKGNTDDGSGQKEPGKDPVEIVSDFTKGDDSHLSQPETVTHYVRIHYHRNGDDGSYASYRKWEIWAWDMTNGGNGGAYAFDHYDDYGVYVDIDLDVVSSGKEIKSMGFIVAITKDWTKDPDGDRELIIPATAKGGIYDIYVKTKSLKIYDNPSSPLKTAIDSVFLNKESRKKLQVTFDLAEDGFVFNADNFSVKIGGQNVTNFTVGTYSGAKVTLTFTENLDWTKDIVVYYQIDKDFLDSCRMVVAAYFDSEEFVDEYTYEGDDLGAVLDDEDNPTKTTFKVWAPTSSSITLNIYDDGDYDKKTEATDQIPMTLGEKGVWSTVVNRDLSGKYYTYTVTNSLGTHEVVDPYAKSAGVNGRRGMIVNFKQIDQGLLGWAGDVQPDYGSSATDAIIYESHVRDMTINPNSGVSEQNRGKFLGLTETGTTYEEAGHEPVSTGLDHLEELGITHVQLQPFFDYASVDESVDHSEMSKTGYNWGYDPLNYNVLEGGYSTNPRDGVNRIIEFKKMVMAMHQKGLNINMDVVYNHTASSENSYFNYLVPNYYYRTDSKGKFYNGSGCGNEVACDRPMARKFVVESCKFWIGEYHLSGFRFDLMGLMDNQTMIDIYNECKEIYGDIMVYGEPWTGGTSKLDGGTSADKLNKQQTVQASLNQSYFVGNNVLVGAFNDQIRNAVKGDNAPGIGWVQGDYSSSNVDRIVAGAKGTFLSSMKNVSPQQVLNYVSCHDNYTLHDQLIMTNNKNRVLNDMYSQSEALVLFSEGVAFMQEGEDFLRSKAYENAEGKTVYEHNSYNVGDFINNMDYSLKVTNHDMVELFKEMIALRKAHPEFRLATREAVNTNLINLFKANTSSSSYVRYTLTGQNGGKNLMVIHTIFEGEFANIEGKVLFDNLGELKNQQIEGSVTLKANQTIVVELN